jgi:hypothetical protein
MPLSVAERADLPTSSKGKLLNPAELKIDLLCKGVRIDESCRIQEDGRPISVTPSDLASGLEMILPGEIKELWVNAPILEKPVEDSPYRLLRVRGEYQLVDERRDLAYNIKLAPKPDWYDVSATSGIPMSQIGVLQGTCLSIRIGEGCCFWNGDGALKCLLCRNAADGLQPGTEKTVRDVVETARMAQQLSGITLVILRGGYQGPGSLSRVLPYLSALKQEVGILVAVQFPPEPDLALYDQACSLGADHFSFCLEFFSREYFDRFVPGKARRLGRDCFFRALEHCARLMGKGRVSGEVIAGVEPVEETLRAVDYFVGAGALPLVCIFRPLRGTAMEEHPAPRYEEMLQVFRHVYGACRAHHLPIGFTPNVNLSVLPHPEDTIYLAPDSMDGRTYQRWIFTMKELMRPYFLRRMRKHKPAEQ